MAISDPTYRLGVLSVSGVLVATIGYLRFCGSVTLPPKPPPPAAPTGTARELVGKANAQQPIYLKGLHDDAQEASVPEPGLDAMGRKLAYHGDDKSVPIAVGETAEIAGLRLTLQVQGDELLLAINNPLSTAVAYRVDTMSTLGSVCNSAPALPFDAMVIRAGTTETRVECIYRKDASLKVTRVETVELPPLAAYYVDHVPPSLVGIEDRIARGHHVEGAMCSTALSQMVRSGIENNEIQWRDLVDFYARHNCQRYSFPPSYRAFTSDGQRALPVVE